MSSHFQICVLPRERPLDTSPLVVSASLPGIDLAGEGVTVGQAPIQALAVEDADFNFRHVQPTGMLRGVMKFQPGQKSRRGFQPHDRLEGSAKMGVQVIHDQMDFARGRVHLLRQILHKGHEIRFGAPPGDLDFPMTGLGFHLYS